MTPETLDLVMKLAGLLAGVFATYKAAFDLMSGRKPRLREEYEFVRKFITEFGEKPEAHPYIVERGFHAITGHTKLTAPEIRYLLTFPSPMRAVRKCVAGRRYVDFDAANERFRFDKKFEKASDRAWTKRINVAGYIVFGMIAFAPLFFAPKLLSSVTIGTVMFFVAFVGSFGALALQNLNEYWNARSGEELIAMQAELVEAKETPWEAGHPSTGTGITDPPGAERPEASGTVGVADRTPAA